MSKTDFELPVIKKGDSRLQKYLIAIINYYGQSIFREECNKNREQFTEILKNSRNRIAHTKSRQGHLFLNGEESYLYLCKLSILYRIILFDLLDISKECYTDNLYKRTDILNQHRGILGGFLEKLEPSSL